MSRLQENDVRDLPGGLEEYDRYLRGACGVGLGGIARHASGGPLTPDGLRVSVVPVTAGLGIIGGFCGAVAAILRFLGADASVTESTDVRGVWEAVDRKCDVFFMADDHTFLSVNPEKRLVSDNSEATGRGFAAALDLAAGGITGKGALVLGAGPVGQSAAAELLKRGAEVCVYDVLPQKTRELITAQPGARAAGNLEEALCENSYLLDATPAPDFLSHAMLREDAVVAAPGVPQGVEPGSRGLVRGRLLHDVLEIGVATMLYDVL